MAIDAAAGKVYWLNLDDEHRSATRISTAAAAACSTRPARRSNRSHGLAIDPAAGRIYWANSGSRNGSIGYANLNGSGGGQLNTTGATVEAERPRGRPRPRAGSTGATSTAEQDLLRQPRRHRRRRPRHHRGHRRRPRRRRDRHRRPAGSTGPTTSGNSIGYAGIERRWGGTAQRNRSALIDGPVGLAIDILAAVYWANDGDDSVGYASISRLAPAGRSTRPGPPRTASAFPVMLESPRTEELTEVQGAHKPGSTLTCSQGHLEADLLESFLYRAPQSFSYQWFRNGKPIAGATRQTIVANKVGTYSCERHGNQLRRVRRRIEPASNSSSTPRSASRGSPSTARRAPPRCGSRSPAAAGSTSTARASPTRSGSTPAAPPRSSSAPAARRGSS